MNVIAWVVLGILAGAIAKAIYPGTQGGGIIATMVLGVVGAFVGGTVMTLITTGKLAFTASTFSIPGVIVAVLGAMLAIFVWGFIRKQMA